jgi:uncharacterized OsmC-like protein
MATSNVTYQGGLRTRAVHLQSGESIITDAPLDNKGKGEAFSPTDLLATSLASCMMTLMGIAADTHGINLGEVKAEVTKIMTSDPRRVAEIQVVITVPGTEGWDQKNKLILERAALTCPVWYSLHPDIQKKVTWVWA